MVTAAERLLLLEERDRAKTLEIAAMQEKLEEVEELLRNVHQQLDIAQRESTELRKSVDALTTSMKGIVQLVDKASGGKMLAGWIFGGIIFAGSVLGAVQTVRQLLQWKF